VPIERGSERCCETILVAYGLQSRDWAFVDSKPNDCRSDVQADLKKNPDGSVDLYMGPTAPAGFEKTGIPTVPSKAWVVRFGSFSSV
jgi:hypothetical protein